MSARGRSRPAAIARLEHRLRACVGAGLALICALAPAVPAAEPDPLAVAFGSMPALWAPSISPDGSKVVFLHMHPDDLPIASVVDLTTGKAKVVLASTRDGFDISWCGWANDERLLCGYSAVAGGWDTFMVTRLVGVNADGSRRKVLLQSRQEGNYTQFMDQVVDWLPDDPKHILAVTTNSMPGSIDRHRPDRAMKKGMSLNPVDIYTGAVGSPVDSHSGFVSWISDGRGSPRLYLQLTDDDVRWFYRLSGATEWRRLHAVRMADWVDDDFFPVGFGEHPNRLLVVKPHEGRQALWSIDLESDAKQGELVFSHPEVDVDDVETLGKYRRIVAIRYSTDRPHRHFFDASVNELSALLSAYFSEELVEVVDESWDQRYSIVFVSSDQRPGSYYRYDAQEKQLLRIADRYPLLESAPLPPVTPIRYPARDGVSVPAYLTRPADARAALPAVILPHGGPQSRDEWGFDWLAQFLAAKGFAVLQSNYRGSSGYGSEWGGEGGFRAWRAAINDLSDGAAYLVKEGIADPQRICIVGASYGGYAALLSGLEQPERYRCIVSIAGVTDPELLIEDQRHFVSAGAMQRFISFDDDVVKRGSPLKRASEIRAPVLLVHGTEDVNVRVDHSQKLASALKRKKKTVEFVEYEGIDHYFWRSRERIDMLDRIGAFLDAHIGRAVASK